jgi:hypothetical protein
MGVLMSACMPPRAVVRVCNTESKTLYGPAAGGESTCMWGLVIEGLENPGLRDRSNIPMHDDVAHRPAQPVEVP